MAGHSKWANIKRRKAVVDAKRSRAWTKVLKEIQVATRIGGADADSNARLRLAIDKARAVNVPKDSIKRSIDKGAGAGTDGNYEEVVYEGYGPGGVAVVLECMTDNRNRTVGEIRHALERFGGNMGTSGSVSWMFHKRGIIHIGRDVISEDRLMELALEAGAQDVRSDDEEVWTVETDPSAFLAVKDALTGAGVEPAHAEIDNVPDTRVDVDDDKAGSLFKLLDILEDLDDVQNVYTNHSVSDQALEQYAG